MAAKISVIIPVYNTADYLQRCLDSILNNTHKNLEVICINDGSSDNSGAILNEYAKCDSRLVVIHKENEGVSVARNTGLDIATGEFIAFIDSDDWVHPQYFEILLNAQNKLDADCVVCGIQVTENYEHPTLISIEAVSCAELNIASLMADKFGRTRIWGRIYRKLLAQGIEFPAGLQIAEDTVFNLHILCQRDDIKIAEVSERLYFYYQHRESAVHSAPNSLVFRAIPYYIELLKMASQSNGIYIAEQIIKTTLAYRYLSMFKPDYPQINTECRSWLQTCSKYMTDFPLTKRFIFFLFAKYPFLYRMYRIIDDKSMLIWERNEKRLYNSQK